MSSDSQFQKKSTLENARVQFETVDVIPKKKKKKKINSIRESKLLYDAYFIFRNKHLSIDFILLVTIYNIFQNFRLLFQNKKRPFIHYLFSKKERRKRRAVLCGINMRITAIGIVFILILCVFQNMRNQKISETQV